MKRIVAVAIGEAGRHLIQNKDDLKDTAAKVVRRYLHGLVGGLNRRGYKFGTNAANPQQFVIHFHLTDANGLANIETFRHAPGQNPDVIFCMSTLVAKGAGGHNLGVPIVGIVSDPAQEGLDTNPYCGASARRIQTAGDCFDNFRLTVPELTRIFVLGNSANGVSNRALQKVRDAAQAAQNFPIEVIDNTSLVNFDELRARLPERVGTPCPNGLLVLPVDTFLGRAREIIRVAQRQKRVPAFFPVPDFVKPRDTSAIGAYGVPQRRCGVLMAEQVHHVFATGIPTGPARWIHVPDYDFEFLTSAEAAVDLGITLGTDIPPPVE